MDRCLCTSCDHLLVEKFKKQRDEALKWKEAYREVAIRNWKMWCAEYERASKQQPMPPSELKKESEGRVDAQAKRIMEQGITMDKNNSGT